MQNTTDKLIGYAVNAIAFALGLFHLLNVGGILVLSTRDIRITHLLAMLVILFLTRASLRRIAGTLLDRIIGGVLIAASLGSCLYILSRWKDIAMSGGDTGPLDAWIGLLLIVLVLEGARRGVGVILALICLFFFTYPFFSEYLPGVLGSRGYSVTRISELLTTTSQGVFGIPLGVSATYIVLFSIYGAFLSEFGAGDFFFKLANRLTRGMRAAGAKTAVIFSTLLGMISGSAAGNVAVTGTLTIPMMKKEGYAPHQAGAIEAVVSTGGQMMPPVMGAAAFIMAEIVGVPYSNVMQVALIPALLFFASLFFVVHLQAGKSRIVPLVQPDDDDESIWMILFKGGQFIIPFATLIAMMLNGFSPFKASYYSIIVLLVCHVIWTRRINLEMAKKAAGAITEGTKAVVPIAIACAAAGIIAGTLGVTGLGSKISGLIIAASGGITFFCAALYHADSDHSGHGPANDGGLSDPCNGCRASACQNGRATSDGAYVRVLLWLRVDDYPARGLGLLCGGRHCQGRYQQGWLDGFHLWHHLLHSALHVFLWPCPPDAGQCSKHHPGNRQWRDWRLLPRLLCHRFHAQ